MAEPESLALLGEDAVLARLLPRLSPGPGVVSGPGDDCAVLRTADPSRLELLKTDCVLERVHFSPDTDPARVGWKVAARNVSDFAAMGGGLPRHALVTAVVPRDRDVRWLEQLYEGLETCARRFHFAIVGGETSSPPPGIDLALIAVTLSGTIDAAACVNRSGARHGDAIWVTGRLGGSLASGRHLDFTPRLDEARWLTAHFSIHAMMDLSDGLARDLPRLARASRLGFLLERDALPVHPGSSIDAALHDGEDYELLFTTAPGIASELRAAWPSAFPGLDLTRIGTMDESASLESGPGPAGEGWDAFRSS